MPEGIGRGANSAVARPRGSWPKRGGAVWVSGERRQAGSSAGAESGPRAEIV